MSIVPHLLRREGAVALEPKNVLYIARLAQQLLNSSWGSGNTCANVAARGA